MSKLKRIAKRLATQYSFGLVDYKAYIESAFEAGAKLACFDHTKHSLVQFIVPGVVYKLDKRKYTLQDVECEQYLEVLGFQHIVCLDWDWPDMGHKTDECITIADYGDVQKRLVASGLSWRVYITPGGVRAFCISDSFAPRLMPELDADPLFIKLCKKTEIYWARVVPKAERPLDWVAEYVETIGAKVDEQLLSTVIRYHDDLIVANRGYKELSPAEQAIINSHLDSTC